MSSDDVIPGDYFSPTIRDALEDEFVSHTARNRLTRLLRRKITAGRGAAIYAQNQITNIVNRAMGRPGYVLEAGIHGYEDEEYAYHDGEFAAVLFRPETPVLADVLCDLINEEWLDTDEVNQIVHADGCGFSFGKDHDHGVTVELFDLSELPDEQLSDGGHPNIRLLFDRMSRAMRDQDWPLVVATGASVAETLAKDIVANPNVQNQSLGGWFQSFRNHSALPDEMLDLLENIFNRRNVQPLAAHGSTSAVNTTREEAATVLVIISAAVRLERTLAQST
jgi:hypothetical protein